jgi:hypothetical protein
VFQRFAFAFQFSIFGNFGDSGVPGEPGVGLLGWDFGNPAIRVHPW